MTNSRTIISVSAALVTAVLSLITAVPGITWLDAGDFVTASSVLGVPHATGFPVYTLLGHLFTDIPIGNIASRMAMMSAVFAGLAVLFLLLTIQEHVREKGVLISVSIALVLVHISAVTLFVNSRVPEVYSLSTAIVAASFFALERYMVTKDMRWVFGLAVISGLGIAHHALFRMWVPVFVLVAALFCKKRLVPNFLIALALGTFAMCAYLYLPVAAWREPSHNWGDPSTLPRFVEHVTAQYVRDAFGDRMFSSWFSFLMSAWTFCSQLWDGLGPLVFLGIVGMAWTIWKFKEAYQSSSLVVVGCVATIILVLEFIYSAGINPWALHDYQNGQMTLLILSMSGTLFACHFLLFLSRDRTPWTRGIARVVYLLLPCSLLFFTSHDFRGLDNDWSLEDMMTVHLTHAPHGALTVLDADSTIASLLYMQMAVNSRPDMVVLGRNLIALSPLLSYAVKHHPYDIVPPSELAKWRSQKPPYTEEMEMRRGEALLKANLNKRSVFWAEIDTSKRLPAQYKVDHEWPMGQVRLNMEGQLDCTPSKHGYCSTNPNIPFSDNPQNLPNAYHRYYREFLAHAWGATGKILLNRRELDAAALAFDNAHALAPWKIAWKNNQAVLLAARGRLKEAVKMTDMISEDHPLSSTAVKNGYLYSVQLKDKERIERYKKTAQRLGIELKSVSKKLPVVKGAPKR